MAIAQEQLQCFDLSQTLYPNVSFTEVERTDFYRKEKPYRLLINPGKSAVTMTFGLSGADNISKVIIELYHRSTAKSGVVDIYCNDVRLNHNVAAPKDKFVRESFLYGAEKFHPYDNTLTIILGEKSPGTYFLSDVTIYVKRIPDKVEDDIDATSRQFLVNIRKLMTEREKVAKLLEELAASLDGLQATIAKATDDKQVVKCNGNLLMLGNTAVEKITGASGCPVVAVKEEGGYSLAVGGEASENNPDLWEEIQKQVEAVAEAEKLIKEDRKCRNTITSNSASLKKVIGTKEQVYRKKFKVMSHATLAEIVGYRLANTFSADKNIQLSQLYKSGFKNLSKVIDSLSFAVLSKALAPENGGLDSSFTMAVLMGKVADAAEGSPKVMADKLRLAAETIRTELATPRSFLEDCLTSLLNQLKDELVACNLRNVARLIKQLTIFDQVKTQHHGVLDMSWINKWVSYEDNIPLPPRTSIATALSVIFQELQQELKRRQEQGKIDLVIVSSGSVGAPTNNNPVDFPVLLKEYAINSNLMFPTENLSSVTFYAPWGSMIDASIHYAVIKGNIQPNQTRYLNTDTKKSVPKVMSNFNTLTSDSNLVIPNAWVNAFTEKDGALEQLSLLLEIDGSKPKRPFIYWRQGSMPSFFVTSMASLAALLLSTPKKRVEVCLHHAQCLVWPNSSAPPQQLLSMKQYHNALPKTHNDPCTLTVTPLI